MLKVDRSRLYLPYPLCFFVLNGCCCLQIIVANGYEYRKKEVHITFVTPAPGFMTGDVLLRLQDPQLLKDKGFDVIHKVLYLPMPDRDWDGSFTQIQVKMPETGHSAP